MNAVARKKGLGRGLEALLGGSADITEAVKIEGAPNVLPLCRSTTPAENSGSGTRCRRNFCGNDFSSN